MSLEIKSLSCEEQSYELTKSLIEQRGQFLGAFRFLPREVDNAVFGILLIPDELPKNTGCVVRIQRLFFSDGKDPEISKSCFMDFEIVQAGDGIEAIRLSPGELNLGWDLSSGEAAKLLKIYLEKTFEDLQTK